MDPNKGENKKEENWKTIQKSLGWIFTAYRRKDGDLFHKKRNERIDNNQSNITKYLNNGSKRIEKDDNRKINLIKS